MNATSASLQSSITAGIGLLIAFIGLQNAGLILKDPGTAVKLNTHFSSPDLIVFFFGLLLMAVLRARNKPGAVLMGIIGAAILAVLLKVALPVLPASWTGSKIVQDSSLVKQFSLATSFFSAPPSLAPTAFKLDLVGALSPTMWPFIIVFLFMI